MAKRITDEEQKKLLQLFENSRSGNDDEVDAFYNFLEEVGIGPDEVPEYLAVKNGPETEQEKRLANKGKAADEKRSADAIPADKIASAYGVNLKKAEEDGELVGGGLQKYLDDRFVMRRMPNESGKDYVDRNRNAFESLGLNWDNKEDRASVAKSIQLAEVQDERGALAEDLNGGAFGKLMNIAYPRMMEHATRDVLNGEETDGYFKDGALDSVENGLQFAAAPVSEPAGVFAKYLRGTKAFKNFKKGKAVLDGRTKANKAANGAGTLALIAADASAVPLVMEVADAAAYDDPENSRSEFSGEDVALGSVVNAITPAIIRRSGTRNRRMLGNEATKGEKALQDIDNYVNLSSLLKYLTPYVTNKAGKTETARNLQFLESIVEEKKKQDQLEQRKSEARRTKYEKWANGFAIPYPGDRDFEEYQQWKNERIKSMAGLGKYL